MKLHEALSVFQKTLRDGHFKALQGKLELLERLCRALQKERNDLNNRLSLLQQQGAQTPPEGPATPPEGPEPDDSEGSVQGDEQEASRPPETGPTETSTTEPTAGQPEETASTQD